MTFYENVTFAAFKMLTLNFTVNTSNGSNTLRS